MFKVNNNDEKNKMILQSLERQYEDTNFPLSSVTMNRPNYVGKYGKTGSQLENILEKIKNKQPVNVMLFGNDLNWKYDVTCYIFNVWFCYNCRKSFNNHDYDPIDKSQWIDSRNWVSNFNRVPTFEDIKSVKFVVFFDFCPPPKNEEHIRLFQSLLVFRSLNSVSTVFDGGRSVIELFNDKSPVFDSQYSKTIIKNYTPLELKVAK